MEKKPRAVIAIPCYNEESVLAATVEKLHAFCRDRLGMYDWQILIADNFSQDGTGQIGRELAERLPEVTYFYLGRKGRGNMLRTCWTTHPADFHAYMDSDLATHLEHLPALLDAVRDGADLAVGCRLAKGSRVIGRSFSRELSSRGYNAILKCFFLARFHDAQCGFKAIGARVRDRIIPLTRDDHWFFDSETLILAQKSRLRLREIPVVWEEHLLRDTKVKLFRDIRFFLGRVWNLRWRLWFDRSLKEALRRAGRE